MTALVQTYRLEAGVFPAAPRTLREATSAHDPTAVALSLWVVDEPLDPQGGTTATAFPDDGKWEAIRAWFDERLRRDGQLTDEERAILFTEYKDTLDYLLARLASEGYDVMIGWHRGSRASTSPIFRTLPLMACSLSIRSADRTARAAASA